MAELELRSLTERMRGRILRGDPSTRFERFNIDSRLTRPGELFFAIRSERDGHDYVADALRRGAAGAVVARDVEVPVPGAALILVDDTLRALQRLARSVLVETGARVVGITGSTGKTTTKEFTHVLFSQGLRALKSKGNFNNHLGLPLSLLDLSRDCEWAVLEYGMSHAGEIADLTSIAPPDVAVVTNVNPVHLEFFPDLEAIADAKRELVQGMKPGGTAVLNADDPLVRTMAAGCPGPVLTFGLSGDSDISTRGLRRNGWEGLSFELVYGSDILPVALPFLNDGFLYDFLAAAGAARAAGLPPEAVAGGIERLEPILHRGGVIRLGGGVRVVDDSYNSNPAALAMALRALADLPGGRKIAVLGDMLELGRREVEFHRAGGQKAAELGIDLLITVGPLARHIGEAARDAGMSSECILSFSDSGAAAAEIPGRLRENDVLLVKGSRGIRTDIIIDKLKERG